MANTSSKIWVNFLLLAFSLALAFGTAELIVRSFLRPEPFRYESEDEKRWNSYHPKKLYAPTPGFKGRLISTEFNVPISINERGFRGTFEPGLVTERIFVFGDSFAFGVGLTDENTIPSKLEKYLRESGRDADVWNMGVPSYSVPQYAIHAENYAQYKPTHAIFCILANKIYAAADDIYGAAEFEGDIKGTFFTDVLPKKMAGIPIVSLYTSKVYIISWLSRNSALYNYFMTVVGLRLRAFVHRNTAVPAEHNELWHEGWAYAQRGFDRIEELSQQYGFSVTLVYVGIDADIRDNYRMVSDKLRETAAARHWNFVDTFDAFKNADLSKMYYHIDGHFTAAGADRMAKAIALQIPERKGERV